jgi:hypothetical protein
MTELQQLLPLIRSRITRSNGKGSMNEENTKATLVEPVLRALGWDAEDIDEVVREYKTKKADKPVDYALLLALRKPLLFVEAKALGQNLIDRKWTNQIMGYASVAGVRWIVLTDGDEWRIYNSHAAVPVDEKLFRSVRISDTSSSAEQTLELLSKEQMAGNRIEFIWNIQFVDKRVKSAITDAFGSEPDGVLVRLIRKRYPTLTPSEIKSSLGRAHLGIEFPEVIEPPPPPPPPPPPGNRVTLFVLIKAGLIKPPLTLERTYKGTLCKAVLSVDGRITYAGEEFSSPSAAGARARQKVLSCEKPPATNGWIFWQFRRDDGKLANIDELAKLYSKTSTKHEANK